MHHYTKKVWLAVASASLVACANVEQPTATSDTVNKPPALIEPVQTGSIQGNELSLEKIMAHPDWIGRQPQNAYWRDDSAAVLYSRKREGEPLVDLFERTLSADDNGTPVALSQLHQKSYENRIVNRAGTTAVWVFESNLFSKNLTTGTISQLTRDNATPSGIAFMNDGRLSYRQGNNIYAIDVESGRTHLLASWRFETEPTANEAAKDYIAQEQHKLISVVARNRQDREARFAYKQALQNANQSLTPEPFYLPEKHNTVTASLSPDGRYLIVAIEKDTPWRDDADIMPNYIGEDGRIKSEKVRRRVADSKPQSHTLYLMDLQSQEQTELSYTSLPGYNEDVLEAVKRENAQAKGESYTANRLPRDIGLLVDWTWSQSAIQWRHDGQAVAIMLEAWDNKDRWIATVNLDAGELESQHRLHDDAWVNYTYNDFGWLPEQNALYFLSEQSGYSHLYVMQPGSEARALTSGQYVVSEPVVSKDGQHIYFRANKKHPGIYEVYRVETASGDMQQLTDLNGLTEFKLSPNEQLLLLTHSKLATPPELYIQPVNNGEAVRITHTVSEQFASVDWVKPQIVAIPSSHTDQPIYSRVYLPEGYQQGDKRKAVVFSHGAGYLQNAHLGWSGYFREFMFHSLLVSKGYVVLDMDYRASKGYGREWRTAIYRHMGKPEIEDLQDGVNWIVENANVDRERIGHYGGSYGGFITFMALFKEPDLFKSGAALRPVSDWAHYNHGYTSNILNTPDVDPIAYERSSPIYFAEGLQEPLLINAPMVDDNVFFVDVVRLVQRLIELEKQDFETAIYPVEAHGFVQPSSWLDEYRRIYKLFETTL